MTAAAGLRMPMACRDLADLPASAGSEWPDAKDAIDALGEKHRRFCAWGHRAVLLVVQGLDASGKNSLIRDISHGLDPAGFRAWNFGPPSPADLDHDFLWRAGRRLPAKGEIAAFNRSYYDCVLAERLWPPDRNREEPDWAARHNAINHFESRLVDEGTVIIKCWLHMSEDKHRHRLLKRLRNERKRWKFDPSDLRSFHDRHRYLALAGEAFSITNTAHAPWYIIPSDSKKTARAMVASILAEHLDRLAPEYPKGDEALCREMERELLADEEKQA